MTLKRIAIPADQLTGFSLDDVGYCIECGEERYGTEPDAREYPCEECGTNTVYGAQELLIMGIADPIFEGEDGD